MSNLVTPQNESQAKMTMSGLGILLSGDLALSAE